MTPLSTFPLFLMVGVAWSFPGIFPWSRHDDATVFRPIMGRSEQRRICVELCTSGLGGEPCGEDCVDLSPLTIPIVPPPASRQSADGESRASNYPNGRVIHARPRNETCPVLCENNLGYPLCNCNTTLSVATKPNFVQICGVFCIKYQHQLFGCQSCDLYQKIAEGNMPMANGNVVPGFPMIEGMFTSFAMDPAWTQWCIDKCEVGEGGSACNCDRPVMVALNT